MTRKGHTGGIFQLLDKRPGRSGLEIQQSILSGCAGTGVGAGERPVVLDIRPIDGEIIHLHNQIGKGCHKALSGRCDRRSTNGRSAVV
jgi:hypothetical protein